MPPFTCIPPEVLEIAFSWLTTPVLDESVKIVCKKWYAVVCRSNNIRRLRQVEGMYIFGGWDGTTERSDVEFTADFVGFTSGTIPSMHHARCHSCAIVIDRQIHVIGGRCDEDRLNVHEMYDPISRTWVDKAPMLATRSSMSLARIGWHLYAFGGFNGDTENLTAERYSVLKDVWEWLPPMPNRLSQAATVVSQTGGMGGVGPAVYLVGGCSNRGETIHNTVLLYDPVRREYNDALPKMLYRRVSCCAFEWSPGLICAVGGGDGHTTLDSTEFLDFRVGRWQLGPKLSEARVNACMVRDPEDGMPILIGGFRSRRQLKSCEKLEMRGGTGGGSGSGQNTTMLWEKLNNLELQTARDAPSGVILM